MITQWVLLGVGLVLILLTALYVAAEFSLITVDRATVTREAAAGDPRSKSLLIGLKTLSTQLSTAQVGISATTLALGFIMQPSVAALLAGPLTAIGLGAATANGAGVVIALILANILSMVFGELVPKNLAIATPMAIAKSVIGPIRFSTIIFRPFIWVLNGIANGVLRAFGIEPQEELRSARSAEELSSLVMRSAAQGTLEGPTAGLLARSISFSSKTADEVLTPRVRVRFIKSTESAAEIITAAAETGHSRFPVIGEDSDDVLGLVHLKKALSIPREQRSTVPVSALLSEVPVIPGTMPLDALLDLLRDRGHQMAVVADEYGGTAGVLTLEDVVEELVGEITDEHDSQAKRGERRPDKTWLLPGTLRPDEVADMTGVELPEAGEYETIAGLVMSRLGRMAGVGDYVVVEATVRHGVALGIRANVADAEEIFPDLDNDIPRAGHVRLDVIRHSQRRIDAIALSAIGVEPEED
ncbi:HlyC/CorC family transporter [Nakamurella antarctica]|uniref:HlyC/CorC family transporter n=1 Tax=Nakamurella antarctica TaxID=1902245 RepID=A0A3G8ZTW2_9ACTN|nr:hemolysin family protein [Nakamurella antarctica]AZI57914.1 HlyC/CorC family transporter [Nakamurella antarctica]